MKIFASHGASSFFARRILPRNQLANDLERYEVLTFLNAGPFEHFDKLIQKSRRIMLDDFPRECLRSQGL